MVREDPLFKTGWKFDHVWNILKNFEKFNGGVSKKKVSTTCGSDMETENPTMDSPTQATPGLSSFSLNSNHDEDVIGESPSQRPRGMKKSKLKRKLDDQTSAVINSLEKGNKQLLEQLNQTNAQREHHFEIQKKNYALKELKEENKMLFLDLNSVQDPNIRAYIQAQQAQILQNRSLQQQAQQAPPPSTSFGQYFNNFNGSGGDLPDY